VVDPDMTPCGNGVTCIQAARELRSIEPGLAILILSQVGRRRFRFLEAMGDRPSGFWIPAQAPGSASLEDFAAAVRRVAPRGGGTALDPTVVSRLRRARPNT